MSICILSGNYRMVYWLVYWYVRYAPRTYRFRKGIQYIVHVSYLRSTLHVNLSRPEYSTITCIIRKRYEEKRGRMVMLKNILADRSLSLRRCLHNKNENLQVHGP